MRHRLSRTTVTVLAGATAVLLTTAASPAGAAARLKPKDGPRLGLTIDGANTHGGGCPKNPKKDPATVVVSPDGTAFTVIYSAYQIAAGGGDTGKGRGKPQQIDCTLALKVDVPKGYTYTIDDVYYRGYGFLAAGASGTESAEYSFRGPGQSVTMNHAFTGPMDDDWEIDDPAPGVYEQCGKQHALVIKTNLTVNAAQADPATTSYLVMDSTDGTVKERKKHLPTTYHLAWKAC